MQLQLLNLHQERYEFCIVDDPIFDMRQCRTIGYLLVYPRREDVKVENDCDKKLKDYYFGHKNKPHRFCPECGSSVLIDFKNSDIVEQRPLLAMNVSIS